MVSEEEEDDDIRSVDESRRRSWPARALAVEEAGRGREVDQSSCFNLWKSDHYFSGRNSLKSARFEEKKLLSSASADGPLKQNVHLCTLASTAWVRLSVSM